MAQRITDRFEELLAIKVLDVGDHPHDILSGDHYHVGIEWDGLDGTLDFADHFTRRVTATAVRGSIVQKQRRPPPGTCSER